MDTRPYWHEAIKSIEARSALIDEKGDGYTFGMLLEEFRQPDWCGYPDALAGDMGCWSLWGCMVTGRDYCRNCDQSSDFAAPTAREEQP